MKKIIGLFIMFGLILASVKAQAITLGEYDYGALVPAAFHDGKSIDTVVGITCQFDCTEPSLPGDHPTKGKIHWVFYDVDSHELASAWLECTDNDLVAFDLGQKIPKYAGTDGYLVFRAYEDNATKREPSFKISANAFLVDTAKNDAIFIPVVPVKLGDFKKQAVNSKNNSIATLENGIDGGTIVDARYWIDPQYNADTTIIVWLTDPYVSGPQKKAIPMTAYVLNDDEEPADLTIRLPHELNKLCPSCWKAMPTGFVDGFLEFVMPASVDGFVYSYISSTFFSAQQTLLAAENGKCNWDTDQPSSNTEREDNPECVGDDNTGSGS